VLSPDATSNQIARLLAQAAPSYLTKPVDVTKLLSTLDELLNVRVVDRRGGLTS
jgi:hypothetical protein